MFAAVVVVFLFGFVLAVDPVGELRKDTNASDAGTRDLDVENLKYDEFGDELLYEPRVRPYGSNLKDSRHYRVNPCRDQFYDDYDVVLLKRRPCVVPFKAFRPQYDASIKHQPMVPVIPPKSYPAYKYPTLPPLKQISWPVFKPVTFPPKKQISWPVFTPVTFPPKKQISWPVFTPVTFPPKKQISWPVFTPVTFPPKKQISWPVFKPVTFPPMKPINWPVFTLVTFPPKKQISWPVYKPVTFAPLKQFNWPVVKPLPSLKPLTFAPLKTYPLPTFKPFVFHKVNPVPTKSGGHYLPSESISKSQSSEMGHIMATGLNKTLYLTYPKQSLIQNVGNTHTVNNFALVVINNCEKTTKDICCKVATPDNKPEIKEGTKLEDLISPLFSDIHFSEFEFDKILSELFNETKEELRKDVVVAVESTAKVESLEIPKPTSSETVIDSDNKQKIKAVPKVGNLTSPLFNDNQLVETEFDKILRELFNETKEELHKDVVAAVESTAKAESSRVPKPTTDKSVLDLDLNFLTALPNDTAVEQQFVPDTIAITELQSLDFQNKPLLNEDSNVLNLNVTELFGLPE